MRTPKVTSDKVYIFEKMSVPKALATMAIPTIISQLITLIYNIADTWYIGQTGNPYMVAASSLVLTVFLMTIAITNLFGVGGSTLAVRLLGSGEEQEARKVVSLSLTMATGAAFVYSLLCLIFMNPLLRFLGASNNTIGFARQYLTFVVVLGGVPTVLSSTMSSMLRNVGYSKEAAFGLGLGGVLNVILDPLFMFVFLPDGYEVMGAAIATLLSNCIAFLYFIMIYRRVQGSTILSIPKRVEKIRSQSMKSLFSVGVPAAIGVLLFDATSMLLNRLVAEHGDPQLAAMGIVLKIERLPMNIGIGFCLGMVPLAAYNYAAGNYQRMRKFFTAAMLSGLAVSAICVILYQSSANWLIRAFIDDPETIKHGVPFLRARSLASPVMFLSFHIVHFMQAIDKGKIAFIMPMIRQLVLNIPILLLLNYLFDMSGIIWTQLIADGLNATCSFIIYFYVMKKLMHPKKELTL